MVLWEIALLSKKEKRKAFKEHLNLKLTRMRPKRWEGISPSLLKRNHFCGADSCWLAFKEIELLQTPNSPRSGPAVFLPLSSILLPPPHPFSLFPFPLYLWLFPFPIISNKMRSSNTPSLSVICSNLCQEACYFMARGDWCSACLLVH